jgi:hypothetical protein
MPSTLSACPDSTLRAEAQPGRTAVNGFQDPRIAGGGCLVALRAAFEGDPGVVLIGLIFRSFRLSAVAVGPVGLWATLLCCPQIHRLAGAKDCGPAQPARRAVRTCRIGEAGTAPTSTAKSRIDAVPHTVLSTHAGAVFQSLPIASMCAVARGDDCPTVSVRALPSSGAGLQPLRPWPDLLRTRLFTDGAARRPARGRAALPGEPPRSSEPCGAGRSLSRPTKQRDASGFPATSRG